MNRFIKVFFILSALGTVGLEAYQDSQNEKLAKDIWRKPRLKGSCQGCHGADWFDLARMGSSDATVVRRAIGDGATAAEAQILLGQVKALRVKLRLPGAVAETFRPLQPAGRVVAGATPIERDIAFGRQLQQLLPTLMGGRIASLEQAQKAKDELLAIDVRKLAVGIEYPLWSSDAFNGPVAATLNDWVADIAREPTAETPSRWFAAQDAYLANPTDEALVGLLGLVDTNTRLLEGQTLNGALLEFELHKYKAQLIVSHVLRMQALGRPSVLDQSRTAFSKVSTREVLPGASLWEVGDKMRAVRSAAHNLGLGFDQQPPGNGLMALGAPAFVAESISTDRNLFEFQHELRLPWLWIGFTMDPGLQRTSGSNSTKSAEYLIETLIRNRMFVHNSFLNQYRLVAKGFLEDAWTPNKRTAFQMDYGYFVGYGREILKWNESRTVTFPTELKQAQAELFHRLTANGFRMSMYLYMDALRKGGKKMSGSPAYGPMESHFLNYQPASYAADKLLMDELKKLHP